MKILLKCHKSFCFIVSIQSLRLYHVNKRTKQSTQPDKVYLRLSQSNAGFVRQVTVMWIMLMSKTQLYTLSQPSGPTQSVA